MPAIVSLHKGLAHSDFEKNLLPESQRSPLRFVPTWSRKTAKTASKHDMVKITINGTVSKSYRIFTGGNMEEACMQVRLHEGILLDMNIHADMKDLKELLKVKEKELKALGPENVSKKTDLTEGIREINSQMLDLNKRPFEIFEKMLGEELRVQLRDIVEKECDQPGAISLRGVKLTTARGRTLKSIKPVYIKFTGLFGPQNSYELCCRYLQNCVIFNLERCTALQIITRTKTLNRYLPYLPSLRYEEGCPDVIPVVRMFNDYELCTLILGGLTVKMSTAYNAIHGEQHAIDVNLLGRQLEKVRDDKIDERDRFLQNARKAGLVAGDKRSADSDADNRRIPRKRRNNKNNTSGGGGSAKDSEGRGDDAATGKGKRNCKRCAKWAPRIQNTHNTLDCGLWNEDGSKKARGPRGGNKPRGDRRYNNRISAGDGAVDDAAAELSKMKLQMKKYRKQAKKAKKKARRARRGGYASSSDSSSSSSSS